MTKQTPASNYGKKGTPYLIGNDTINIDIEFVIATLMAVIVVIRDIAAKDYKSENGLQVDQIIEGIAQQLYDQITVTN